MNKRVITAARLGGGKSPTQIGNSQAEGYEMAENPGHSSFTSGNNWAVSEYVSR
jgi:hypothetical protein